MREDTINRIRRFTSDRDWDQFHSPANLAKSISIEANELLECFQWSDTDYDLEHVKEELADVIVYCQDMLDKLNLDVDDIVNSKMTKNEEKYPIDKSKGTSLKYDEFDKTSIEEETSKNYTPKIIKAIGRVKTPAYYKAALIIPCIIFSPILLIIAIICAICNEPLFSGPANDNQTTNLVDIDTNNNLIVLNDIKRKTYNIKPEELDWLYFNGDGFVYARLVSGETIKLGFGDKVEIKAAINYIDGLKSSNQKKQ